MNNNTTDAASMFTPIWRRKWLILAVAIAVAAGTYEYYTGKPQTYKATTQLYLGNSEGHTKAAAKSSATNVADIINSQLVGEVAKKRLRKEHDTAAVKGKVKAAATSGSPFINITAEARNSRSAVALANATVRTYIKRQRNEYLTNLERQIGNARQQLRRIEPPVPAPGSKVKTKATSSAATLQAANLAAKISDLETQLSTYVGVQQVGKSAVAQPLPTGTSPKRNAIFGFILGLLLASIAAYIASRFDRRLRTLSEVEGAFQAQVLAALPAVRAPTKRRDGTRAPAKALVEPLRRLHTTLALGGALVPDRANPPRVILFLSADAGDGKSTLVANLARVQSEAGERVAVLEADFRRPVQGRLLDVDAQRGLADVLVRDVRFEQALQTVSASSSDHPPQAEPEAGGVSTAVAPNGSGSLSVLLSGGPAPNPPALLASAEMGELLRSLADAFDYVLIDAPPPLEVSDVMPLLPAVDGVVIVARIGHTRDVSSRRLVQLLGRTGGAPLLGVTVNCATRKDIERYGFAWAPAPARARRGALRG